MHARRAAALALSGLVLCAWCGWVSGFHRSTTGARATWGVSLAAVVAVNVLLWRGGRRRSPGWRLAPVSTPWPRPGRDGPSRTLVGVLPWTMLALVVITWEILGIDTGVHTAHLTISALAQAFRPLNAALLLAWMAAGVGYGAARERAPSRPARPGRAGTGGAASGALLIHLQPAMPALLLPDSQAAGIGFWLGLLVACMLVDLVARQSEGRLANAEEIVRLVTGPAIANAVVVVAWTYAGWHLFAH